MSGGNIIAFTSTGKDDVSTWSAGDDVTDSSGFTGSLNNLSVSSLRFGAAGAASTVTINADNRLNLTNNGILVAPAVGSGAASITGGILSGGTLNEIIVHQNNPTAPFVIGSSILGGSALTKTGAGTLNLTGNNTFHGTINVNDGTLIPSGGKAIGDFSLVALKSNGTSVLDLNNGTETIGALSSTAVFSSTGIEDGLVSIGTGTLTINNTVATRVYQGSISGTGTLIKNGVSSQQLFGGTSGGFTGNVIINQGLLDLSEGATVLNTASSIVINGPGELISDQETSANVDHIGNTTPITLNNTASGRGLWVRNPDQGAGRAETVGAITLGFGHNVIQVDENGAAAASARTITATAASLDRGTNHATLLVRGQMLGLSSGERGQLIFTAAPSGAIGGGGAAATTTITIFPYMVGESAAMTDATLTDNYGNSFVMNTGTTNGLRPLDLTTEYTLNQAGFDALTGMAVNNVRFALNPAGTLAGTATQINSLVLDSSTEALAVNGPASSLNIKSGAILATTTTPANAMSLGGFTGLTTDAGNDYIVYVTNPTSTFTLNTPLTTAAPLVKAGAGTLVLGAANSTTDVYFNQGLIQTDALNKLGTGDLKFQGGGLRWATGATFDPSSRVMSFGTGGGSLDTNGNNVTLANAIGNGGAGGLTKLGTGILTLNAPVTYTGTTTVTAGTLQYGVAAALPSNASVVLNGGTLDTGAFTTSLANLSVQASSTLTGSANVTFTGDTVFGGGANRVLTVNNTGLTTITGGYVALVDTATTARTQTIAGTGAVTINSEIQDGTAAGSLTITNTNTTTLTGHNTYSGTTTMNAATGTLVVSGDNRTAGATTLTAGTIQLNSALNGGLASGLLTLTSGTLQAVNAARTLSNNVNLTAATVSGTQSLTINGTLTGVTGGSRVLDSSITGGTLTLGDVGINAETANARTLTIAGTGATTINGIISNGNASTNNGMIITNTNTTTLAGANTYSGDTTISAGTTTLGNSNVIPDGAGKGNLSIAGGATLDLNGKSEALNGLSGAGTIDSTAAGAMSLTVGGNNQTSTFSGTLANTTGTLSLTKTGTGDLTLSGTSTHSGSTTVSGGKLYIDSATAFPATTAGLSLADGAEFHLRGTNPSANVVRGFSGTGNVVTVGSTTGGVLGFGIDGLFNTQLNLTTGQTMTVNGTLTTAIHVNNAPTAGQPYVLINAADDNAIFGSGTFDLNPVVFNGGSFSYALSKVLAGAGEQWVLTPTAVAAADNVWWKGDLGGIGTGVWSASTTSGTGFPTNWDTDQSTGTDAAVPPDSGSIVHFSASGATNLATTLGANLTIQELIVHAGVGAVSVGGANTLTIGNVTDAAGITLLTGAPNLSFSSGVALGKAQSFNVADITSTLTFTGALSGVGSLGINDNGSSLGTVILGGAAGIATYSGATDLVAGKLILQGGANNRLPTTTALTMGGATTGATLQLGDGSGASSTTIGTLNSGAATTNAIVGGATTASTLTIVQSADGSFNGAIGGVGTNENQIAIIKQGGSTLTLNGANTYVGATTINDGTLKLGSTASLSGTAGLSIVASAGKTAAFDVNGRTVTLAGAITLGGGDSSASASILNSTAGGLLTLGGNVTYDATNNPLASVINANLSNGSGARTFTVNDSTTVAPSSAELTLNGTYASANSATVTGTGNMTINGAWTLTGSNLSLTKSGTGTLTINAATNTTGTGDWNINGGVVNATAANSLNAQDNVIVTGTGVQDSTIVNISGASVHQGNDFYIRSGARVNVTVANGISTGSDQILIGDINSIGAAAAARLDLAANISSGNTLQLGGVGGSLGNITGTGTITSTNGYSLRGGSIASGITLAGTGSITKVADGTVTFSGARTTSGATNIQEGSLVLDYTTNNASKIGGVLTLGAAQGNLTSPTSLVINGNDSAATAQSVTSTTVSNTGHTLIDINNGTGQTASLALNAITRSVVGGTVGFDYASTSTTATTTSAATNALGWATVTTGGTTRIGAIDGTGNIVQGITSTQNSVASWIDNTNVINSGGGYSGTISNCVTISSLTFDAAAASSVVVATGQVLNITSGGILVNSTVGSFASTISGGSIYGASATNPGELIIHQNNSAAPLTISSSILASSGVTKSGAGILVLSGNNNYLASGSRLTVNEGTVRVAGGNAIGDTTTVMMRSGGSLDLNNTSEAIGNLGADSTNFSAGGIDLGTGTITINQAATSGFVGSFTGGTTSTIFKNGTGNLTVQGNSPGFSGTLRADAGQITLTGNFTQFTGATAIVLNGLGNVLNNQDQTAIVNRINDAATLTLNNTIIGGGMSYTRTGSTIGGTETIGALTLGAGHNVITATATNGAAGTFTMASLAARNNRATLLVRGAALGDSATAQRGQIIFTTAPTTGNAVIGGGGAAGTTNTNIFAWMVGDTSATGVGNSFVRNTGTTNGLKPLDLTTEYINNSTSITGTLTDNIRYTATAGIVATPTAINSLVLDSAAGVALTGSASSMEITSGAILAAGTGSHSIGGITGLTTGATRDYNVFVTNAAGVLSIDTALATAAPLVKSGAGTLKLTSTSNAINAIYLNHGNLLIDDLDKTGTGTLNFFGGTLKLDTTFTDDLGGKTMVAGTGGGTIDVGALSATATGLNLSGAGSFTKTGTGTLTIGDSTTITHTGQVIVSQGTLVLNNATGGSIGTGGLLISGTSNPTTVQLTQNNQIANTAPITLANNGSNNQTLDLNNFSDTVGAVTLTSASTTGTVIKTGATGVLTLNGDLTLNNNRGNDGGTTEFQVLITGSGAVGTRTTDGTLDLGGVNRRIVVDSVITNPNRNDAVIETVIQNGGIIKSGSRALYLTNVNTYSGPTNIQQGTVVINSAQSIGDGSLTNSITLANGSTLRSTGANVDLGVNRTLTLSGVVGGTLEVTGTNKLTASGPIVGDDCMQLTKAGTGALILTNDANSYAGGTLVSAGTLDVSNTTGSGTGTGALTVAVGATLSGSGVISPDDGKNVVVNGTLSPGALGALAGTDLAINLTGASTLALNGAVNFTLFGNDNLGTLNPLTQNTSMALYALDWSNLTIGTGAVLNVGLNTGVSTAGWSMGDAFKLFDWLGVIAGTPPSSGAFASINLPTLDAGKSWDTTQIFTSGTITIVPEPGRVLLLMLGFLGLAFRRRR